MIREIRFFIFFALLWSIFLVSFNYMLDPLQYYRKAQQPVFIKNQRYQIPGLVRNYPFDTIMVGTSHSENFLASQLDNAMGTHSLNLASSGSSAWEQSQVIDLAVRQGPLTNVIWEMNYNSFAGSNPNLVKNGHFPMYLYHAKISTLFYYLYSIDTLRLSIKAMLGKGPRRLDGLNSWAQREAHRFDGKHVIEHYCRQLKRSIARPIANYQQQLEQHLAPVLQQGHQTRFFLFIPPLSIANFALNNQLAKFTAFRTMLYQVANKFSNATVIDFTRDLALISNLNLYKDTEHFSQSISATMLIDISQYNNQENNQENNQYQIPVDVEQVNREFVQYVNRWRKENTLCGV
jgi:hypothetical protein